MPLDNLCDSESARGTARVKVGVRICNLRGLRGLVVGAGLWVGMSDSYVVWDWLVVGKMYDDVNMELKDAKLADEGKGDEEMTDAEKDEALAITTVAPALVASSSRSVSSNCGSIFLNLDSISSVGDQNLLSCWSPSSNEFLSTNKSQPKTIGKFAQAKEAVFKARDTQMPQNQEEDMGKTDEPPSVKADPNDWFKKPKRPPT
ncbi:hypothetical protein Tco_0169695 [Tanacetum coccineum]